MSARVVISSLQPTSPKVEDGAAEAAQVQAPVAPLQVPWPAQGPFGCVGVEAGQDCRPDESQEATRV